MIRTIRPLDRPDPGLKRVTKANGFSLHAGVSCQGHQKDKRERLCRYISRPAVAVPRLSLSSTGKVVYTLKTPYRDGTTQVAFEPIDLMTHIPVRHPSGDLRSSKSAVLPICRCPFGGSGAKAEGQPHPLPWRHRPDPGSPAPERTGNTDSATAGATDQSATWDKVNWCAASREGALGYKVNWCAASREGALGYVASFRWEGIQQNSTTPARKPVKTTWHELSRAPVQEWTDLNGMLNAANRISGSIAGNFDRSAGPVETIGEDLYSQ